MKIRTCDSSWRKLYEKHDEGFVCWIPNEELALYKKALEKISEEKVQIHTYPNYTEQPALLKIGTDADVEEFFKQLNDVEPSNTNESNEAFNIIQKGESIGFEANPNTSDEEFAKGVANFLLANRRK